MYRYRSCSINVVVLAMVAISMTVAVDSFGQNKQGQDKLINFNNNRVLLRYVKGGDTVSVQDPVTGTVTKKEVDRYIPVSINDIPVPVNSNRLQPDGDIEKILIKRIENSSKLG